MGVREVLDGDMLFFAFDAFGTLESTNAPSIGRIMPAAFLKKRLRVIISSSLGLLLASQSMLLLIANQSQEVSGLLFKSVGLLPLSS